MPQLLLFLEGSWPFEKDELFMLDLGEIPLSLKLEEEAGDHFTVDGLELVQVELVLHFRRQELEQLHVPQDFVGDPQPLAVSVHDLLEDLEFLDSLNHLLHCL